MARMTAASMLLPKKQGAAPTTAAAAAKPKVAAPVRMAVPKDGEVTIRRVDNGYMVSGRDKNYNRTGEAFAADLSDVQLTNS